MKLFYIVHISEDKTWLACYKIKKDHAKLLASINADIVESRLTYESLIMNDAPSLAVKIHALQYKIKKSNLNIPCQYVAVITHSDLDVHDYNDDNDLCAARTMLHKTIKSAFDKLLCMRILFSLDTECYEYDEFTEITSEQTAYKLFDENRPENLFDKLFGKH